MNKTQKKSHRLFTIIVTSQGNKPIARSRDPNTHAQNAASMQASDKAFNQFSSLTKTQNMSIQSFYFDAHATDVCRMYDSSTKLLNERGYFNRQVLTSQVRYFDNKEVGSAHAPPLFMGTCKIK